MNDSIPLNQDRMHRSLAAIVITDVVNYSGMMSENEHLTLRLVQRDMDFLTKQCKRFEGEVLKSTGDGLLMTFDSAVNAVSCALSIQRGFAQAARQLPPNRRLQHRIGIHLGDVYLSRNDAMGDGVNVAARLQEQSEPGGVCISQTVYDVVKNRLGIKAVFLGPKELKNISEAVPIYKLLLEATAAGKIPIVGGSRFPGGSIGMAAAGAALLAMIVLALYFLWPNGTDETTDDPFGGSEGSEEVVRNPRRHFSPDTIPPDRHREHHPSDDKRWKTVMPVIDPKMDGFGRWELKPEGLVGFPSQNKDERSRIGFPAEPTGSYELEVCFESRDECTVVLLLCVGETMIAAVVGGTDGKGGLHEIGNDPYTDNETTAKNTQLVPDREHELHAMVKPHPKDTVTIAVSLDGRRIIDWTGPIKALTMPEEWNLKQKSTPGVGVDRTPVLFRRINIREIEGEIRLREPSELPGRRVPFIPRRGGRRRPVMDRLKPEIREPQ